MRSQTLKALSILLHYPDQALLDHLQEMEEIFQRMGGDSTTDLTPFFAFLRRGDIFDLCTHYLAVFEGQKGASLYLFDHLHGQSRERGQAMADLQDMYRSAGFEISAKELPDYLPLFLEYLSQIPFDKALSLLGEITPLVRHIGTKLAESGSVYALLCACLLEIAGEAPLQVAVAESGKEEQVDLAAVDKAWEEAPVLFGKGDGAFGAKAARQGKPCNIRRVSAKGEGMV